MKYCGWEGQHKCFLTLYFIHWHVPYIYICCSCSQIALRKNQRFERHQRSVSKTVFVSWQKCKVQFFSSSAKKLWSIPCWWKATILDLVFICQVLSLVINSCYTAQGSWFSFHHVALFLCHNLSVINSALWKQTSTWREHLAKEGIFIWPIQSSIKYCLATAELSKVEPQYNDPLCNKVLSIMNDFLYSTNSQIYQKEPRNKETSL